MSTMINIKHVGQKTIFGTPEYYSCDACHNATASVKIKASTRTVIKELYLCDMCRAELQGKLYLFQLRGMEA